MRKILIIPRLIGFGLLILTLTLLSVVTALAQAPDNDDFGNPTVITELPFESAINTSEATTAGDDPVDCFTESGVDKTVWYAFTPDEDLRIVANAFTSGTETNITVVTGSPGSFSIITCRFDEELTFDATAGITYYFMIGTQFDAPGGNLVFSVNGFPPTPPFTMQFHLDSEGSVVAKTGEVTLHGTITCSRQAYAHVFGRLEQRVGRALIKRFFDLDTIDCNGETPWSATFSGLDGRFDPGKARAIITGYAEPVDGLSQGVQESVDTTVSLKGK